MNEYEYVTDDMFDAKLAEIIDSMTPTQILNIAYNALSEELNNEVLAALDADKP
jgi:hypothetical protein